MTPGARTREDCPKSPNPSPQKHQGRRTGSIVPSSGLKGSAEIPETVSWASNCTSQHAARTGTKTGTPHSSHGGGMGRTATMSGIPLRMPGIPSQPEMATPNARTTVPVSCHQHEFGRPVEARTRVASALWKETASTTSACSNTNGAESVLGFREGGVGVAEMCPRAFAENACG